MGCKLFYTVQPPKDATFIFQKLIMSNLSSEILYFSSFFSWMAGNRSLTVIKFLCRKLKQTTEYKTHHVS